MEPDWKDAWQPLIQAVGQDFSEGEKPGAADCVEKGAIRRYLEPLEFDCPLHYDDAVARAHGYDGIIAPYSSYLCLTIPEIWQVGTSVFTSAERHAQPEGNNPIKGIGTSLAPPTTGYFATDLDIEYRKPVMLGDRLRRAGRKLLSCEPRETKVGRGAFTCWETEIRNQREAVVALLRLTVFSYNPHPAQR